MCFDALRNQVERYSKGILLVGLKSVGDVLFTFAPRPCFYVCAHVFFFLRVRVLRFTFCFTFAGYALCLRLRLCFFLRLRSVVEWWMAGEGRVRIGGFLQWPTSGQQNMLQSSVVRRTFECQVARIAFELHHGCYAFGDWRGSSLFGTGWYHIFVGL